jgi:SAM-dependent methyltransferase
MPDAGRPAGLAATFQHPGVAAAYRHRPPYPAEVFDVLTGLITGEPRWVLDLGAGEGALARPLAARAGQVDRVDAVEISAAMIETGRRRPGGDSARLRWLAGAAETVPLPGRYALVTAGASLHWMDWAPVLRRAGRAMTPGAKLAVVELSYGRLPWHDELQKIIARHSRATGYDPDFSLPRELARRGLLRLDGQHRTAPVVFRQRPEDYLEQFHSTSSLARELMPPAEAARFGAAVLAAVRDHERDGLLDLPVTTDLTWGRPTVA